MSATRFESNIFLVESEPVEGNSAKVTRAADFSACMVQLSKLLCSGRKIFAVRHAGRQVSRTVLDGMIRLVSRRSIMERLANSFDLDPSETETSFGHLLIQDAVTVQDFLQGWSEAESNSSDSQRKRSTPKAGAASSALKNAASEVSPNIEPAPGSDSPPAIDQLGQGFSAEPRLGLGGTAA